MNTDGDAGKYPGDSSLANSRQVGGEHYKNLTIEPWDAMESWLTVAEFVGFLKGNIIKYLARAHSGKESHSIMIAKAEHYQQKLSEVLSKYPEYHNPDSLTPGYYSKFARNS